MASIKTKEEIKKYYIQKARSSFKARFDLLLFELINLGMDREITTGELDSYEIADHQSSLKEYINEYWQQGDIKKYDIHGKPIERIYQEMKDWRVKYKSNIDSLLKFYIENIFPRVFPPEEFNQMVENANECEYCHITLKQINDLIAQEKLFKKHITRGWSMEIDRKAANLEYTQDNCVICCYWCNNAKTDEFDYKEFKKIGVEIQKIWNERLNS